MEIFKLMKDNNQEQIAFYSDKTVKLRAVLAVHSTALGPAIGGIRIFKYNTVEQALTDLCRLSRAMTYKAAAGGLNFGGGYMVVIEQPGMVKDEPLFRSLGRFIESFNGRFIAGGEMGVTEECMEYMSMETRYLSGLPAYFGGSGNHSYMGAYGTFKGIQAAAKFKWNSHDLSGRKILIQGYGRTGSMLADMARKVGADVKVTDILERKLDKARNDGYPVIPSRQTYQEPCDILAPCAVGAVICPQTIEQLQCSIIAGSANNQLLNTEDEALLKKRNILYVPDFIINVGGILDVAEEYTGYKKERVTRKTENIYDRVLEILAFAAENDITNHDAAVQYACKRIEGIKQIQGRTRMERYLHRRRSDFI